MSDENIKREIHYHVEIRILEGRHMKSSSEATPGGLGPPKERSISILSSKAWPQKNAFSRKTEARAKQPRESGGFPHDRRLGRRPTAKD
jgi:hypothetical protein